MASVIGRIYKVHREGRLKESLLHHLCILPAVYLARAGLFGIARRFAIWANQNSSLSVTTCTCRSVAEWSILSGARRHEVHSARPLELQEVEVVGEQGSHHCAVMHGRKHQIQIPATVLYEFSRVDVIGGSEMVFVDNASVLYDEIALGDPSRYGSKTYSIVPHNYRLPYLPAATRQTALCIYQSVSGFSEIACAISLLKDHSMNYYHWLVEVLPRAILALQYKGWGEAPILLDAGLPNQFIETIRLIAPTRNLIQIPPRVRVRVAKLYFPSALSISHDYYGSKPAAEDFVIAPEAVGLLRENYLKHASTTTVRVTDRPYVYIARSGGKHRALLNEASLIEVLEQLGFAVVYPGELCFAEQVALFFHAKVIIGPTGAGMANIVFANPDCRIAVLAGATLNANYYLFAQLAQHAGIRLVYIAGRCRDKRDLHSDYDVDAKLVEDIAKRLIKEVSH